MDLMREYVAATIKPRYVEREDDRLEVWIDLLCRDKESAVCLKRILNLPGSVRGSVLRFRTPNLWAICVKLGLSAEVASAAGRLDKLMKRVNPTPEPLKMERREALRDFGATLAHYMHACLERRGRD